MLWRDEEGSWGGCLGMRKVPPGCGSDFSRQLPWGMVFLPYLLGTVLQSHLSGCLLGFHVLCKSAKLNIIVNFLLFCCIQLFPTSWTAACQASLSFTITEFAQTHVHWVGDAIPPSHPVAPFSSCPQSCVFFSQPILLMIRHEKYTISYIKFLPEMPNLQLMRKCTETLRHTQIVRYSFINLSWTLQKIPVI